MHPGGNETGYDVFKRYQYIGWNEVRGLGQSGMGTQVTG